MKPAPQPLLIKVDRERVPRWLIRTGRLDLSRPTTGRDLTG
jgi:hypothetical protein